MNMSKVRIPLVSSRLPHAMLLQRGNSGDGRDKLTNMFVRFNNVYQLVSSSLFITTSSLGLMWKLPGISFPPGCQCPFPYRINRFTLKCRRSGWKDPSYRCSYACAPSEQCCTQDCCEMSLWICVAVEVPHQYWGMYSSQSMVLLSEC